jgi:hypothetical protein
MTMKKTKEHGYAVGSAWFFRTVTFHVVGRVRAVHHHTLELEAASHVGWPSERVGEIFAAGRVSDCEPLPDGVQVHLAAITDATPWRHDLPGRAVK